MAQALKVPVAQAAASMVNASVLHMDETHYPREGSANWVWGVVQPNLVVYSVLPSRARYVIHDLIGHSPKAVVVSDRYAGYGHINPIQRQVCWAHLLRDFNRTAQRAGQPGRIGQRFRGLSAPGARFHGLPAWRGHRLNRQDATAEPAARAGAFKLMTSARHAAPPNSALQLPLLRGG